MSIESRISRAEKAVADIPPAVSGNVLDLEYLSISELHRLRNCRAKVRVVDGVGDFSALSEDEQALMWALCEKCNPDVNRDEINRRLRDLEAKVSATDPLPAYGAGDPIELSDADRA